MFMPPHSIHPPPPCLAFHSSLATYSILPAKLQQRCVPRSVHECQMQWHLRMGQARLVG